jgi:phosphopantothenoylcysteine decarboxylase/phosphopantothenate--cysteine ligase
MFKGKTIVLGVTGSIAAFRAASICSQLAQQGADVHVVMTESAKKFITPFTFQVLSQNLVMDDTFNEPSPKHIAHIHFADRADLILIAPATAHTIGKIASGLADNMLTNLLLAVHDFGKVVIAPAMNVNMLHNPFVQENLDKINKLRKVGMHIISPATGHLACGYEAEGKFPDPKTIIEECERILLEREQKVVK